MTHGETDEEAGVRARGRVSRERAEADGRPGVAGSHGTTNGTPRPGRGSEGP
ncbi:hypothetical protein GCM10010234_15510 [Streptomyces hawaiiensis]